MDVTFHILGGIIGHFIERIVIRAWDWLVFVRR